MGKIFLTFSRAFPWKLFMKIAGLLTNQFWRPQSPISCVGFWGGRGRENKHTAWLASLVISRKCTHLIEGLLLYAGISMMDYSRERQKKWQWQWFCKVWSPPQQLLGVECSKGFVGTDSHSMLQIKAASEENYEETTQETRVWEQRPST